MKKIFIYIIGLTCLIISSCQGDLLDTKPYDKAGNENMWTSETLADKGVLGVYSTLLQEEIGRNITTLEALGPTGNMVWNYGFNGLLTGRAMASDGFFSNFWQQHYEVINIANDAIANLPKAPLDEEKMGRLMGECKFLRAFAYYRLNSLYQGVPVYLEPTNYADFTKGRETAEQVWNIIIDDLTDCINEVHLPSKYNSGDDQYGRITKGAAYALRGKVYMWLGKWSEAEKDLLAVEKCGYSLYQGNFGDLFTEANEQCDEMIFTLQAMDQTDYGHIMSKYYGSRNTYGGCINEIVPNTDFCETYQWIDGEDFNWEDILPNYNSMTPNERKVFFLRNNLTDEEIKNMSDAGVDMTKYLPNSNEERILKAFTNRDPRLTATTITPYSEFLGSDGTKAMTFTLRWPFRNDLSAPNDIRTNSNSNYYYLFRKFVGIGHAPYNSREDSPIDIPFIRYAGVLLDLAEVANEQNRLNDAIGYINQVRDRAGIALLNSSPATTIQGQADLRERIKMERRWEFAGEGQCLFEEYRWGAETYKASKFQENSGCKEIWGTITQFTTSWDERVMKWPLPASEVQRNKNLTQNTGWES